jgi:aspartyl-tRNA(Asn)/glutamyl-tRNA(Gln) amidotransferase subunit B
MQDSQGSLVDLNRAGVPLIEIVSEPDMHSAEDARRYLTELRTILSYLEVSDLRMEEGSMRCDANVSLKPAEYQGSLEALPRVEVKNVNSIRNVGRAIEYEIERQYARVAAGERIVKETRGFDDAKGRTYSQRSKEETNDYRYFPEPDLPPLVLDETWILAMHEQLPLLPDGWRARLEQLGIPAKDVEVLVQDPKQTAYLAQALEHTDDVRQVTSWMLSDMLRLLHEKGLEFDASPVTPERLVELLALIGEGRISGRMAKEVLERMFLDPKSPRRLVDELGMAQITDDTVLTQQVREVLEANPKVVDDYHAGKERALGFLVGQLMKRTRGQASPEVVNRLLREALASDGQ